MTDKKIGNYSGMSAINNLMFEIAKRKGRTMVIIDPDSELWDEKTERYDG